MVFPSSSVADRHVDVTGGLADAVAAALGPRREALQHRALLDVDRGDLQLVDVGAVVVLGIGDRGLERLLDDAGSLLLGEGQDVEAWSTFLPRIMSATSRPLSADRRTPRTIALVSIVAAPYFLAFLSAG
jgi:hypothetical protein